jgi:hypothetical protein
VADESLLRLDIGCGGTENPTVYFKNDDTSTTKNTCTWQQVSVMIRLLLLEAEGGVDVKAPKQSNDNKNIDQNGVVVKTTKTK